LVSSEPIVVQHVSLAAVSQSLDVVHDFGHVAVPPAVQIGLA